MFDLLAQKDKDEVRHEYKRRRLVVMFILIFLTFFVGILTLLPPHLVAWYKLKELSQMETYLERSISSKSKEDLKKVILLTNTKINYLLMSPGGDVTVTLADIVARQNGRVVINKFVFQNDQKGKLVTNLQGVAKNRDDLLQFAADLRSNIQYAKVDLPVSNFAKESDIDFAITITSI